MILAKIAIELVQILVYGTFTIFFAIKIIDEFTTDAPHINIPEHAIGPILSALDLKDGSILYDLGCGSGKILIAATKSNPNIKAIGIEAGIVPYIISRMRTKKYSNIEIIRNDFFDVNTQDATHIFMYLSDNVITDLFSHVKHYSKKGTRVVTCDFKIQGETPVEIIEMKLPPKQRLGKKLFVYNI